jgi:hypothetical protein
MNGTPSHDPPETVESAFTCASNDWPFAVSLLRARTWPMPAVSAREPPPERLTPTLPGVAGGVT